MGVYIPQYLDRRVTLLGLPLEEFAVSVTPSLIGFVTGHGIIGIVTSFSGLLGVRVMKDMTASFSCRAILYKYLPTLNTDIVPSHWQRVGG